MELFSELLTTAVCSCRFINQHEIHVQLFTVNGNFKVHVLWHVTPRRLVDSYRCACAVLGRKCIVIYHLHELLA